jgi:hypothetical protein
LLGSDREINSYTTAAAKQWLYKQRLWLGKRRSSYVHNILTVEIGFLCSVRAVAA